MWLSGLYLLDFGVTPILCQRHQSILLSAEVTCQCIIIYFDEPTSPHPAVLTCFVQLWVSWVGAGSNNDDDSGETVFPVNNQDLSLAQNLKHGVWLNCILVYRCHRHRTLTCHTVGLVIGPIKVLLSIFPTVQPNHCHSENVKYRGLALCFMVEGVVTPLTSLL